ncbi:MAG: hypothetical protein IKC47_05265 [Clostridia bacterium]|nr:hypothetical protein [Clostridia bacterium]
MSTKFKAFKIISVLMAMVFMSMLLAGCKLYHFHKYSSVDTDAGGGRSIVWIPDENWSKEERFLEDIWTSPDKEILLTELNIGRGQSLYVKNGSPSPYYTNLEYDNITIIECTGYIFRTAFSGDYDPILANESLQNVIFYDFVEKDVVQENSIDYNWRDYKFSISLHSTRGFSWCFFVFIHDNDYYLASSNEEFGYLVVDEFADWLRTLEPSQN